MTSFRYKNYDTSTPFSNPNWRDTMPDVSPQAGKQNGLRVVVDSKSSDVTIASVQQEFFGVQVSVTPMNTFPLMLSNSFLVAPGMETQVEISGLLRVQ